jgi:hypothetical protein
VPQRVARSWKGRPSPLPALRAGIRTLEHAGGACIAIPSHTAHYWYEEMLLACTELPLVAAAASGPVCLDAPEALARACIAWHQEHGCRASDLAVSTGNWGRAANGSPSAAGRSGLARHQSAGCCVGHHFGIDLEISWHGKAPRRAVTAAPVARASEAVGRSIDPGPSHGKRPDWRRRHRACCATR